MWWCPTTATSGDPSDPVLTGKRKKINARPRPCIYFVRLPDGGDSVALVLHGAAQDVVLHRAGEGHHSGAGLVAHLSLLNLGQSLQGGANGGLAVGAHHALDLQCLFHSLFLLDVV